MPTKPTHQQTTTFVAVRLESVCGGSGGGVWVGGGVGREEGSVV